MLSYLSIKSLFELALAEGEGVGTAYEYYVKRLVLRPWLDRIGPLRQILIAGLPEKYGSSLDFLQLADELQAHVVIVDERVEAIDKLGESLKAALAAGWLHDVTMDASSMANLNDLGDLSGDFDLVLSSEVLQRLSQEQRLAYAGHLRRLCPSLALFAPNADNPAHTNLSGLNGLTLDQLAGLPGLAPARRGYLDMPPFPPGMTRTEAQREQATTGRLEALAMWGLGNYARLERFLPLALRRSQAHIVFALTPPPA